MTTQDKTSASVNSFNKENNNIDTLPVCYAQIYGTLYCYYYVMKGENPHLITANPTIRFSQFWLINVYVPQ